MYVCMYAGPHRDGFSGRHEQREEGGGGQVGHHRGGRCQNHEGDRPTHPYIHTYLRNTYTYIHPPSH